MIKKLLLVLIIILIAAVAGVYIYRFQILQYSADTLIRSHLPDYVRIDKITFDARNSKVALNGFKILNPPGYSSNYVLEVEEVSCRYKFKGKDISEGFEIIEPSFKRALVNMERLSDGRLNLNEMSGVVKSAARPEGEGSGIAESVKQPGTESKPRTKLSGFLKLPERFSLKEGKIVFIDRFRVPGPHILTFENVDAGISIGLDKDYTKILRMASVGSGEVNGHRSESIKWDIKLDPTTPKLTMSNRFEVSGVEITPFEPYYYRYSPLVFTGGTFSGLLIFDFDNGNIGSSNEIHLNNFRFYVKPGYENASFWETTVPDLVKYFTTPYGEIVFDFKIKGDMQNPRFYLGPISKEAITVMAIDKISQTIQDMSKSSQQGTGPKNDLEKAKEYIDMFRGMMKK